MAGWCTSQHSRTLITSCSQHSCQSSGSRHASADSRLENGIAMCLSSVYNLGHTQAPRTASGLSHACASVVRGQFWMARVCLSSSRVFLSPSSGCECENGCVACSHQVAISPFCRHAQDSPSYEQFVHTVKQFTAETLASGGCALVAPALPHVWSPLSQEEGSSTCGRGTRRPC